MMQKPFSFNRRRFYVAFSTAAAAALLSLLVFLPQKAADMQSPESSVVQVQALSAPAEAAETEGFGLYIDGVFIAACDERAEIVIGFQHVEDAGKRACGRQLRWLRRRRRFSGH